MHDENAILSSDYRDTSRIYHALLFRRLVLCLGEDDSIAVSRLKALLAHNALASDVAERATPFFWLNVFRMFGCHADLIQKEWGSDSKGLLANEEAVVLAALFIDSFVLQLPSGYEFSIHLNRKLKVPFPNLGHFVCLDIGEYTIRNVENSLVIKNTDTNFAQVLSGDSPDRRLSKINHEQHGELRIVGAANPILFEDAYYVDICESSSREVEKFEVAIIDALDLINEADRQMAKHIRNDIKWYVRIRTDDPKTHRSFTSPQLKGVVFLSDAIDRMRMAEAIIHEQSHDCLNRYLDTEVIVHENDQRYYSPWRDDPRPLIGLMHALYVFTAVARFYVHCAAVDILECERDYIRKRAPILYHRLVVGFSQVPRGELTQQGQKLLRNLEARNSSFGRVFKVIESKVPPEVLGHRQLWATTNAQKVQIGT